MQEKKRNYHQHDYSKSTKTCSKCQKSFPATSEFFHKQKKNKDGLAYICKKCKKGIDKKSKQNSENYSKYQKSPNFVFSQLKYQAKKRNIIFELTFDYYLKNLANKNCHYCGSEETKHWIDRFINNHEIGYTKENSVPCCELCNKMKTTLDPDEFINHCKKINNYNK